MYMSEAQIIKDSINSATDDRLTTYVVSFPRFINAEVLRHRMLSFNSASSRAIPTSKIIKDIKDNPAMPVFWGKNQSGMQAYDELDDTVKKHYVWKKSYSSVYGVGFSDEAITDKEYAKKCWLDARDDMVNAAENLTKLGLHKQIANRIIEPWQNITLIISGTEWENFFKLRADRYAQPEFRELAYKMLELYNKNIPIIKNPSESRWFAETVQGDSHIPYEDNMPNGVTGLGAVRVAVARCARVSYLTQDGEIDLAKDYELYDRLIAGGHFSPCEHIAFPSKESKFYGNFKGWVQYRKTLTNENSSDSRVIKRKVIDGKVM